MQALFTVIGLFWTVPSYSDNWVLSHKQAGYLPLVSVGQQPQIRFDPADFGAVHIAASSLAEDIARVSGVTATLNPPRVEGPQIYIGTFGHSAVIDRFSQGDAEAQALHGQWESFLIKTVQNPEPGVAWGLFIVGSDRRGTAFGVYELAAAMGVSPWHWWADVPVKKSKTLYVQAGSRRFGPPSVKYRGIFINDEDWGLHPWASQTFDPALADIGPRTYERVFDLLLRLKANTLWPAMHEVSGAFNRYPENKVLADRYGIVMGSSHAEPMLRNNVSEWVAPRQDYNYSTNRQGVLDYWAHRVAENAEYENVYTLGMRGIHDSGITAGNSVEEKVALLDQIIKDQRALLAKYVGAPISVPQVFTPYKEVLDLYRAGLKVPEDVTLVWPDDNHGYIRQLPSALERLRPGGSGVYYHLSYLGSPLSYLWLYSTPPALVWAEMHKAYEHGAQQYWIANVGDIKPAEIGIELFLQMAWDIKRWSIVNQADFLAVWAAREFGDTVAEAIAAIMAEYFELNFQRKPEHLQWWLPHTKSRGSPLSQKAIIERLERFEKIAQATQELNKRLRPQLHDAYFQLVTYPVLASYYANQRYFHLEQYDRLFQHFVNDAKIHGAIALKADAKLKALTSKFNNDIASGKWRGIMAQEPADNLWRSYRQTPAQPPAPHLVAQSGYQARTLQSLHFKGAKVQSKPYELVIEAEAFSASVSAQGASWEIIQGLGRSRDSVSLFPVTAQLKRDKAIEISAPYLEYIIQLPRAGDYRVSLKLLPSFPVSPARDMRLALGLKGQKATIASVSRVVGGNDWKQAVLGGEVTVSTGLHVTRKGTHRLRVYALDPGVTLDRIILYEHSSQGGLSGYIALP